MNCDIAFADNKESAIVSVTLPVSSVTEKFNEVAKHYSKNSEVKGFRKGSITTTQFLNLYREKIRPVVAEQLLEPALRRAFDENNLNVVDNPALLPEFEPKNQKKYPGVFKVDGSFSFSVSVKLPPNIELQDYKSIRLDNGGSKEEWTQQEIDKDRLVYGTENTVDRPVQLNDTIIVDFESFCEGVSFSKEEGYRLRVGGGVFLKEFEVAMIGKVGGQEFELEIDFPDSYYEETFAGKTVLFKCCITEIIENTLHEEDDTFAALLGYSSMEEYRTMLSEKWEEDYSTALKSQIEGELVTKLLEMHSFEAPIGWIRNEMQNVRKMINIDNDSDPQVLTAIRDIAERNVKTAFLLEKIFDNEDDLELTSEEVTEKMEEDAKKVNMSLDNYVKRLKTSGRYNGYMSYLKQSKALKFLVELTKESGESK